MNISQPTPISLVLLFGLTVSSHAQRPENAKLPSPPQVNVKTLTSFTSGTDHPYTGVVEKIDGTRVTVNCYWGEDARLRPRTFEAIDAVVDGTLRKYVGGANAYIWSDLKVGDGLTLTAVRAADDDKLYCVDICIWRRPGAKLPKSQRPEKDNGYLSRSVRNDIDNDVDVDDDDIAKAFPHQPPSGKGDRGRPGRLDAEYQKKLDVIRKAKKEKDLKAAPQDKK